MTEVTEKMAASQPEIFRLGRVFERIALLTVWLALIAVYRGDAAIVFDLGKFCDYFRVLRTAAMLALAIIVPLTAVTTVSPWARH